MNIIKSEQLLIVHWFTTGCIIERTGKNKVGSVNEHTPPFVIIWALTFERLRIMKRLIYNDINVLL